MKILNVSLLRFVILTAALFNSPFQIRAVKALVAEGSAAVMASAVEHSAAEHSPAVAEADDRNKEWNRHCIF
jgi:hypothetical protein